MSNANKVPGYTCQICLSRHEGEYYSDDRCNRTVGGFGVCLCESCSNFAARLTDNQYERLAIANMAVKLTEQNFEDSTAQLWAELHAAELV